MICFIKNRTVLLLLLPIICLGQTQKKDYTKLSYDELHDLYFDNEKDQTKQLEYAQAYLAKANRENIAIRKAKANYQFALLYYKTDINKAITYLDSVIKYSQNTGHKFFPAAAYCEKADFLKKQFKFKEAMANYNMAEKIALKTNIDYYYVVREYIGITKSEDLGDYNGALDIYKECYRYYKSKDLRNPKLSRDYQSVIFGLADCYKSLQNRDSTTFYNKLGFRESQITKNEEYQFLFVLNEGANQIEGKNYKIGLDSINKALPKMIEYNNVGNVLAAYYFLGKAFDGLGKKEIAAENFIKVDSIYKVTKEISTEFIDGYPYLITYYKNLGDKENQLKYITAYMTIDSTLQKNYKELNKLVHKEYDIPRLISDKEKLIASLNTDKRVTYWVLGVLFLTTIGVGGFGVYQYQLKKKYRSRFEKIIEETSIIGDKEIEVNKEKENKIATTKIEPIGIAEELVNQILEKLDEFENKKGYLESNITVQMLSTTFETNSKYVSKIVNVYKGKTVTQYINDLRIEYTVVQLQENKMLRKYTIQALALEFGFNNAESFSAAFYKKTGIKPTYFIKELDTVI
ncbi:helix-turn-helix domain-containing protein [Flavobacterium sp. 140616W15]|uniref:helix-turn-helix domain-containing protein n=1 Tax=Flavobacterium sp. 140616W15 TaxID=2478552 RepID=UPI000F0C0CCF|nr:helix-turn-helix domain-containing protein [Flavobacterium sp. 140616W15]AYN05874.1 AraC family transcriptional regulator [Flavobacterium sp. 140616W15]